MARSSYIYIVRHLGSMRPIGFFTVKHEAISWTKRLAKEQRLSLDDFNLTRAKDGDWTYTTADKAECECNWE